MRAIVIPALLACAAIPGCNRDYAQPLNACMDHYVPAAQFEMAAKAAVGMCRRANDFDSQKVDRMMAVCVVREIPGIKTETALGMLYQRCRKENPGTQY